MKLEYEAEQRNGITFVTATVHNPAPVTRHARLENRLESAVMPPRRNGVPDRGWDETGVTLTVPAGRTLGIGYACSAPPADPAVEIAATGRGTAPEEAAELRARRSLGTFRPPRMAVTEPAPSDTDEEGQSRRNSRKQSTCDGTGLDSTGAHEKDTGSRSDAAEHGEDVDRAMRRIELGEQLAAAGVEVAADVLEELAERALVGCGEAPVDHTGIETARDLDRALEDDAETLEGEASRLRSKADKLRRAAEQAEENAARTQSRADRARSLELPLEALERFA